MTLSISFTVRFNDAIDVYILNYIAITTIINVPMSFAFPM